MNCSALLVVVKGEVCRVQGILAVSRAIGDRILAPYVSDVPEFQSKMIENDDLFMVIASDGLWDVLSNEDVGRFVHKKYLTLSGNHKSTVNKGMGVTGRSSKYLREFTWMGKALCDEALICGSADNITVLVIDLTRNDQ
jgi:protein phosphatase 2C